MARGLGRVAPALAALALAALALAGAAQPAPHATGRATPGPPIADAGPPIADAASPIADAAPLSAPLDQPDADLADTVIDEAEPPPVYVAELREAPRRILGFSFGLGGFDPGCASCQSLYGLGVQFIAGLQLAPRVAILASAWSVLHLLPSDGQASGVAGRSLACAAARIWLLPRLWLEAGAGLGIAHQSGKQHQLEAGPAGTLAIGSELGHQPRSGIDVSLDLGGAWLTAGTSKQMLLDVAAMVGFHWN